MTQRKPTLAEAIRSSVTQIAGYRVQPYKAVTDTASYGNRSISPFMANPAVSDRAMVAAAVVARKRGDNPVRSTAPVQIMGNGAAPARGAMMPRGNGL